MVRLTMQVVNSAGAARMLGIRVRSVPVLVLRGLIHPVARRLGPWRRQVNWFSKYAIESFGIARRRVRIARRTRLIQRGLVMFEYHGVGTWDGFDDILDSDLAVPIVTARMSREGVFGPYRLHLR